MKILKTFAGFLALVTGQVEGFIRINFGERYFNVVLMCFSPILFWVLYTLLPPYYKEYIGSWIVVFFTLSPLVAIGHKVISRFKEYQKPVHSYYSGLPWLAYIVPLKESHIKYYVEPLALLLVGFLCVLLSTTLYHESYGFGVYLIFIAGCWLIKGQLEYQSHRDVFLNLQDQAIEKMAMESFLDGKQEKGGKDSTELDNFGYAVPGNQINSKQLTKSIGEMYQGLSPSLQKLMAQSKESIQEQGKQGHATEPVKQKELVKEIER